ncbi:MAG TPA: PAS domain-containing protein, partial [Ktedonobacterales bacterium]|nr:PAS domain-containing protein [Ktedonobacterales bacterium]
HVVRANRTWQAMFRAFADLNEWSADPTFAALPFAEQVERWHRSVRGRHYPLRAVDGHEMPLEQTPTYRALHGETLTGVNAVDERFDRTDGHVYVMSVSAAPIRDAAGTIVGAVLVARDVTAQRQLERQVREQAAELEATFAAMTDAVAVLDAHGRVLYQNPAAQAAATRATGQERTTEELEAIPADRARALDLRDTTGHPVPSDQVPTARLLRGEVLTGANALTLQLGPRDDRARTMSFTGGPLRDAATGQIVGAVQIGRDVTELQRAQAALGAQERLFRTLVEHSPDIIARFDRDLRYLYVSPAIRQLAPLPETAYVGKTNAELGWPETAYTPAQRAIARVFQTGEPETLEESGAESGDPPSARTFRAQILPERADDGLVESVLTVTTDITALKRAEEALRQSEERFAKAFHASPVAMAIVARTNGRVLDANEAEGTLLGYRRDELLGRTIAELGLVDPTDLDAVGAEWGPSARVRDLPVHVWTKAGEERFCLVSSEPISLGDEACSITITLDVTERRRAEEALARQERLFRTLVENLPDVIARFDRDLHYLYINPSIAHLSTLLPEQYIGKTNREIGLPAVAYDAAHRALQEVLHTGQPRMLLEDDTDQRGIEHARYFRAQFLPEFATDGSVESVLTVTTEITDLKRAEQKLREANASIEIARQEEERRKQIAESLRGVLAVLNSTRSPREVLQYIVSQAEELLGSAAAVIYGPDDLADSMSPGAPPTMQRVQAAEGLRIGDRRPRPRQRLPFADLAVEQVLASAQPIAVVGDRGGPPSGAGDEVNGHAAIARLHGTLPAPYLALLVVPIRIRDGIYGCLLLFYTQPSRFLTEEVTLAQAYADQVAQAFTNARLQKHLEQEAAAAERNHLARELHDTVTQEIYSASLIAETLPRIWVTHRPEAEAALQQVQMLTRSALAGLRALLLELRPATLEQSPLAEALRKLGAAMSSRAGVPIVVDVEGASGAEPPLPTAVKVAFYRVAQESLMNATKYAKAHEIRLRLRTQGKSQLELETADDGQGFDPGTIPAGHFGLAIMRERARSVGANVRVRSQAGQGTVVAMTWRSGQKTFAPERETETAGDIA